MQYINTIKGFTGFNNDWDTSYALIRLLGNGVPLEKFCQEVELITPIIRRSADYQNVKNIFQGYYLGKNNDGLISNETLLINVELLNKLSSLYKLGIATSRPRFEALFAAGNLQITPQCIVEEFIVAKEDTSREKPFPDPLLEAKRRMNVTNPVYVGDTINDVVAARKANMPCIFVGTQKLGDIQISKTNQLMEALYE